jgi:hypothetical protein
MDKYCRYDRTELDEWEVEYSARLRTTLVLVITQRVVAVFYRRFGTAYRSHLQEYNSVNTASSPHIWVVVAYFNF